MKKLLLLLAFVPFSGLNAQTWNAQATGFTITSRGLSEIHALDANTVWALAYDGADVDNVIQEFTRTTNGGTLWTPGVIDVGNSLYSINNIAPISGDTAWVSALIPAEGNGVIFKTSDAGESWVQQNDGGFQSTGESFLNGVHFFDGNNGVSFGDPASGEFEIYTTSDGGANWTLVPAANIPNPTSGEWGYNGGNVFIGSTGWLVTNKGRILKTTDMGLTWTVTQAPLTDFAGTAQSGRIAFSDTNNGCLLKTVGTTYTFYTTSNGGATWSAATPFTGTFRVLTYVPGTTTIVATSAVTASSGSAYSNDNGATWTPIDSGEQRGVADFVNGSTGWCAGFSTSAAAGGIFKFDGTLANPTFENGASIAVYPNPANNFVTIASQELNSYSLNVTDLTGKVVMQQSLSGIENSVDVSSLTSGVYLFNINSDSKKETFKIIKN